MRCYALDWVCALFYAWFADFWARTLECSQVYYQVPKKNKVLYACFQP